MHSNECQIGTTNAIMMTSNSEWPRGMDVVLDTWRTLSLQRDKSAHHFGLFFLLLLIPMWVLCCFNLGCETILSKWPNNDVRNTWKKRRNHGRNKEKFNRLRRWCSTEETCIFIIFVEMRWVAWISSKMILSKYLQILGIDHNAHIYLWTQTASNDRFTTERDAKRKCQF